VHTTKQCAGRQQQQWFNFAGLNSQHSLTFEVTALPNNGGFVARPTQVVAEIKTKPPTQTKNANKDMELRKRLCKTVVTQAMTKRLTPREVWALTYRRLLDSTGFNVVSRAIARGEKYIECLQEFGYLQKTLDIAAAL
jgi:hypothetical protein